MHGQLWPSQVLGYSFDPYTQEVCTYMSHMHCSGGNLYSGEMGGCAS